MSRYAIIGIKCESKTPIRYVMHAWTGNRWTTQDEPAFVFEPTADDQHGHAEAFADILQAAGITDSSSAGYRIMTLRLRDGEMFPSQVGSVCDNDRGLFYKRLAAA